MNNKKNMKIKIITAIMVIATVTAIGAEATSFGRTVPTDDSVDEEILCIETSSPEMQKEKISVEKNINSSLHTKTLFSESGNQKETEDSPCEPEIDTESDKDTSETTDSDSDTGIDTDVSSHKSSGRALIKRITVESVKAEPMSVSSIKLTWKAEKERKYNVEVNTEAPYAENIFLVFKENGLCYITGLRENSEYNITITPIISEKENANAISEEIVATTNSAGDVIQEYDYEDGWTSCFAFERASGLTAMPSSGAIYGSKVDQITGTGIRRFENGDYCCAMGEWYGECGDRFLVELENGIQFTTRICDSKGWADDADGDGIPDGRFHWFSGTGNGKCVIEFIYDDGNLPYCTAFSGSYGYYNWNGLDLCSNIKKIQKLATW